MTPKLGRTFFYSTIRKVNKGHYLNKQEQDLRGTTGRCDDALRFRRGQDPDHLYVDTSIYQCQCRVKKVSNQASRPEMTARYFVYAYP